MSIASVNSSSSLRSVRLSTLNLALNATTIALCCPECHGSLSVLAEDLVYSIRRGEIISCQTPECNGSVYTINPNGTQRRSSISANEAMSHPQSWTIVGDIDSAGANASSRALSSVGRLSPRSSYSEPHASQIKHPVAGPSSPDPYSKIGSQFDSNDRHAHHRSNSSSSSIHLSSVGSISPTPSNTQSSSNGRYGSDESIVLEGSPWSSALSRTTSASPRTSLWGLAMINRSQQQVGSEMGDVGELRSIITTTRPTLENRLSPVSRTTQWFRRERNRRSSQLSRPPYSGEPDIDAPTPLPEEDTTAPDLNQANHRLVDAGTTMSRINSTARDEPENEMAEQPAAGESQPRKRDRLKNVAKRALSKVKKTIRKLWPVREEKKQKEISSPLLLEDGDQRGHHETGMMETPSPAPSDQPSQQRNTATMAFDQGTGPSSPTSPFVTPATEFLGSGVLITAEPEDLAQQIGDTIRGVMSSAVEPGSLVGVVFEIPGDRLVSDAHRTETG